MNDKKNDDFTVRMPENGFADREAFAARSPPSRSHVAQPVAMTQSLTRLDNNPPLSVVAYCVASISMTIVNKYVVSGAFWNLNFFYLAVQVGKPALSHLVLG